MKLPTKAVSIFDRIVDSAAALAGVILMGIMLVVSGDVVFRYFLHAPIKGADEISEILMLYITFLGTAWLLKKGGHITIDVLFTRFKPETQMRLTAIFCLLGALISLVWLWYGAQSTISFWQRGVTNPTILRPPRAAIVAVIPVGSLLLLVQFLRRAWSAYTNRQSGKY